MCIDGHQFCTTAPHFFPFCRILLLTLVHCSLILNGERLLNEKRSVHDHTSAGCQRDFYVINVVQKPSVFMYTQHINILN